MPKNPLAEIEKHNNGIKSALAAGARAREELSAGARGGLFNFVMALLWSAIRQPIATARVFMGMVSKGLGL
jgi:hypothetical protein